MGVSIITKQIKYNITKKKRSKTDIKYINVHYTANYSSSASAKMHYNYFNGGNKNASADIFIDENEVYKINDWYNYYTWQCGDGKGKYGITNSNSIGIEICVNGDFSKAINNTIWYLRNKLLPELSHIDKNHLTRHYDASRKLCPVFFVDLSISGYNTAYQNFRNAVWAKTVVEDKDWEQILKDESSNSSIWIEIVSSLEKIGNNEAVGFDELAKYRTVLKYFGELLIKIDDNKDDYKDIINNDITSKRAWKEIVEGLIDLGLGHAEGMKLLTKNRETLKYITTFIEKIDK